MRLHFDGVCSTLILNLSLNLNLWQIYTRKSLIDQKIRPINIFKKNYNVFCKMTHKLKKQQMKKNKASKPMFCLLYNSRIDTERIPYSNTWTKNSSQANRMGTLYLGFVMKMFWQWQHRTILSESPGDTRTERNEWNQYQCSINCVLEAVNESRPLSNLIVRYVRHKQSNGLSVLSSIYVVHSHSLALPLLMKSVEHCVQHINSQISIIKLPIFLSINVYRTFGKQ